MRRVHVVQQGECLSSIALLYGFASAADLHDHPDNAELKQKRKSAAYLAPGDRVVIPDRGADKAVEAAAGRVHTFRMRRPETMLRLCFDDGEGNALADRPYVLTVGALERRGTTDGDGLLEEEVPAEAVSARVVLELRRSPLERRVFEVAIGHLDPHDEPSGVDGRLVNLGLLRGSGDAAREAALRRFQHDQGIDVTGRADEATLARLREHCDGG